MRSFVLERGKGVVGRCAVANLLSDVPDDACLHLVPPKAIDAPAARERGGAGGRREVAVTVDDLPLVNAGTDDPRARIAMVRNLTGAFQSNHIPVTAFVVGRNTQSPGGDEMLRMWLDAGVELGNHTWAHASLHATDLEAYEADVLAGDGPLRSLLASKGLAPRYFRHPMFHAGRTQSIKRDLNAFLAEHGYTVTPATIDNSEWIFAKAYCEALKRRDKAMAARVRAAYIPLHGVQVRLL